MKKQHIVLPIIFVLPFLMAGTCESPPSQPPDAGLYHTYEEIQQELNNLQTAFPEIAQVVELGESIEQRKIWALKISGNNVFCFFKISSPFF